MQRRVLMTSEIWYCGPAIRLHFRVAPTKYSKTDLGVRRWSHRMHTGTPARHAALAGLTDSDLLLPIS
jgi:hypothetical protein